MYLNIIVVKKHNNEKVIIYCYCQRNHYIYNVYMDTYMKIDKIYM